MRAFQPKESKGQQRTPSSPELSHRGTQPLNHPHHAILDLQRTIGNQAVLRLLEAQSSTGEAAAPASSVTPLQVSLRHAPSIQPKLTVNAPGDVFEQEADRVSEQVMRMPEPTAAGSAVSGSSPGVQRKCDCGGTCDECQKKDKDQIQGHEDARVQLKAVGPGSAGGMEARPIVHEVLRSPGQPLDAATRAFMEPRFGHDFSSVRIHTDVEAAQSARQLHASAYTVGDHIVFAEGRLAPSTPEGDRLLAHELAHVVQGAGQNAILRRQPDPKGPHTQPEEASLRVKIVDTLEATKRSAVDAVASAIERVDLAHLEGLGLTSNQVDILLNNPNTPEFKMTFGTAAELELEQAVRADLFLSQYVKRGPVGWVPTGVGKPDWRIETPSRSIPVDLMTPEQVDKKLEMWRRQSKRGKPKWYVEKGLNITYERPPGLVAPSGETAAKAGRLARVGEIAGPFVDAALMLLSYMDVEIDASAFQKLSAEKLLPIVEKELKARNSEIAKVAGEWDAFWGVYANVRIELRYRFVPSAKGTSLGGLQLYDVRFLDMSITAQNVSKAEWNKERGKKEGEGIQEMTLSILVYVPPHPTFPFHPEQPEPTDPLYFSSSRQPSLLPPEPVTTDELLRWARRNYPRLFDDPRLSANILSSHEFTGSQNAREKALNDLRRRIQEEKIPW
jgi:hypothetical protein